MSKLIKICSLALLVFFTFFKLLPAVCLADGIDKNEIPVTCSSAEASQTFLNGLEAFEMGRINDAKDMFNKAIENDPQFAMAYLYLAYTANSDANWKRNMEFAMLNRNHVSEGEKILIDMESALSDKDATKRFELAKQIAELYPSSTRAQLVLAGEYQARNECTKFRDLTFNAILLNPNSPLGYRALAISYLFNEPLDFSLAQKYMEKFVELRPNEAAAHIALGDVHRACMHLDQAIIDYSKAISLDPASDVAYSKRGYINAYQGAFDDACKDWEMSLNLAKSNSKISWPNYSMLSYLHERNGELPIDKTSCNLGRSNNLKNSKHQLEGSENDHYFCCTVISMKHGLYVSPYQNLNECHALQREFTQESKAPDQLTINADITFIKCINAIQDGNFELASKMAQEHARLAEPSLNPRRLQVYNYMMGLINLKQQHYNIAVSNFLNSDLNNSCIKFALGLAYDGLGEWDKAQAMFREVSANNFTSGSKPWVAKISNNWLNAYTTKLNGE